MPKFLIERQMPGVGALSAADYQAAAQKSCAVLRSMPAVQWIESYVTDNKMYCVYLAPDAEAVRQHARRGDFPADSVAEVRRMLDPTTAEAAA